MRQFSSPAESTARIVVLDSDAGAAAELVAALAGLLPRAVSGSATCGARAVELLRGRGCDLLLADIGSAGDLGDDLGEAFGRLMRPAAGGLLVALSADGSVSTAIAAMGAGAHEFIAKPVDHGILQDRVAALAQRHGRAALMPVMSVRSPAALPPAQPAAGHAPEPVLPMWRQEQRIIEEAIRRFSGNITMAAAALELSPSTIYRKRQAWAEMDGRKGAA